MAKAPGETLACDKLWTNVRLATMSLKVGTPYGAIEDGVIAARDRRIVFVGPRSEAPVFDAAVSIDCAGRSRAFFMPHANARSWPQLRPLVRLTALMLLAAALAACSSSSKYYDPLKSNRTETGFRKAQWDEALDYTVRRLREI